MNDFVAAPTRARLSRLAGALLLASDDSYFLVGNTKEPCDWAVAGFEPPAEGDVAALRVRELKRLRQEPALGDSCPFVQINGRSVEAVAQILADRLLIRRNSSFSERLWRILTGGDEARAESAEFDVSWLIAMPERVWEILRETALKCL